MYKLTSVKEIARLYMGMKKFRLVEGVYESFEHINQKIEHVSCFGLKKWKAQRKRFYIGYDCRKFCTLCGFSHVLMIFMYT
jgi:hypothetical protein